MIATLPDEAYAIVEGRHADPFRYLGPHRENDRTVVRAFLPDAASVEAVDEKGGTAALERIHDAGLFAGAAAERLQPLSIARTVRRYHRRSRRSLPLSADPDRFRPLSARRRHAPAALRQARRPSDDARRRRGRRLRGVGAECPPRQRGRRLQFLGFAAPPDAGAWQRLSGNSSFPRAAAGDQYKFEIVGRDGQLLPLKSDPMAFAAELRPSTASIVLDPDACRSRARRRPASTR